MTTIGARAVAAAAALKPLGLSLLVSPGEGGLLITSGPDDKPDVIARCASVDEVDAWIADHRPTGAAATPAEQRKPRVGDVVHYVSYGTPDGEYGRECRAAIVTEVTQVEVNEQDPAGDGTYRQAVGLMVANPTGQFFNRGVLFHEGHRPDADEPSALCNGLCCHGGTWHWPGNQ